jgi:hypothetical protein
LEAGLVVGVSAFGGVRCPCFSQQDDVATMGTWKWYGIKEMGMDYRMNGIFFIAS